MARFLYHEFFEEKRRMAIFLLAASWILGLIAGAMIFHSSDGSTISLMRSAAECRVSIVGLFTVTLLPFLFSAFAVYLSKPQLLFAVAFCKALLFSLISLGIGSAFAVSGWLVRILLMFSELAMLPVLFFYWLLYISGERKFRISPCLMYLGAAIAVICVDLRFISPILATL